ncbi:hypothetical protein VZC37_20700 [Gordonia sp. LSe1-13]|uniref:DUF4145 domain-containing protein n=1 Tax=Gordonia sesuvii TaxID=3116777 RepID=A0ABU7MJM9_9ACTN|nr:hypothetical protein [Gordonia sp. LSe1-13]
MTDETADFDPRKQWTFGYETFGNDDLPAHLLRVSTHHAHAALNKAESKEPTTWLESAIHAGAAVELLAKYHLAVVNPVLIVDMKTTQNHGLLHVLGERIGKPADPQERRRVKTRGPEDCLNLVSLISGTPLPRNALNVVLDARNSAVHMGLLDKLELQRSLTAMVRVVDALISVANVPRSKYWGSQLALINRISSREQLAKSLTKKLEDARVRAKALVVSDSALVAEDLMQTSETPSLFDVEEYPEGTSYWYSEKCPVCKRAGRVFCSRWVNGPEETLDGVSYVEEMASSELFRCGTCRLELGDREMLELGIGDTRSIGYRQATEDEISSYQEHLEALAYQHQVDLTRQRADWGR